MLGGGACRRRSGFVVVRSVALACAPTARVTGYAQRKVRACTAPPITNRKSPATVPVCPYRAEGRMPRTSTRDQAPSPSASSTCSSALQPARLVGNGARGGERWKAVGVSQANVPYAPKGKDLAGGQM